MAYTYGFCCSPSISFSQRRSFISPIIFQSKLPQQLRITQISLQESVSDNNNNIKKNYIEGSNLKKKSSGSRYTILTQVAESLNSCLPFELDVFKILDSTLGSKLSQQDGVIILNNLSNPKTARIVLKYFQDRYSLNREVVLYNVTLKVFRKSKDLDGAERLFNEMVQRGVTPDNVTFSTIIGCGKVYEVETTLKEMMEAGFEPDIYVLTSLIQCYGKSNRTDDVVRTFDQIIELGITPDERTYGCLLNVMTQTPREELGKLTRCIEKANPKFGNVVKLLVESNIEDETFKNQASEILGDVGDDVSKAYCNCLIDLCINLDQLEKAYDLLKLGINVGIYSDIQSKSPTNWSLHLKSLSLGAALTALHIWINDLTKALDEGEELPPVLGINTGHGKHNYSNKGLAGGLELHLRVLNAPFHEAPEKAGWFLTTKVAAKSWLEARREDIISDNNNNIKKNYIWVNPNNPKASNFKQNSNYARYTILTQVAESLNSCLPFELDVFKILDSTLGSKLSEQDGVIILNNLSNPKTARIVLKYFQDRCSLYREVVLYNVTLKVFRKSKDLDGAERLFNEMVQRGVTPNNVTFSTIIGCSRLNSLPGKAVEWFEKMPGFGIQPDDYAYSVMIDCYGRVGNVDMALRLYDRSRNEKWRLDAVTFTTVIKIYGTSGNFDGCLTVFEEMKALGVKPNLVCYNTLLDAMGRANRPWQVKSIYQQILSSGLTPGWAVYAVLIRAYSKARYGEDALNVYKEMRAKGMNLNNFLYNTLLSMCADVGYVDEAIGIFDDMKTCSDLQPDSWTYSSLIMIFSCCGKVYEAETTLKEMMESGFEPNIYVLTSLIQCYGKSNRTDDVVRTFDQIIELGITPDEPTCCCLLNVMTQTPREELGRLTRCIEKANPKLGNVVKLLVESNIEDETFKNEASEVLGDVGDDARKAYCNCLIDLCINLDQLEKAYDLLKLGINVGIYNDIQSKSPTNWALHLKSLSLGAALTALHIWINDLTKALDEGEELPPVLGINTGHGKHNYSDKGLAGGIESHLRVLNAPFHEAPEKAGWFLTTKVAAKSWLEARHEDIMVAA